MRDLTIEEIETVSGGDNWVSVWVNPDSREEGYETQEWVTNSDGSGSLVVTWHSGAFPGQDQVISELNNRQSGSETEFFSWGSGEISVDFPAPSINIATIRPAALLRQRHPAIRPGSTPGHPNSYYYDYSRYSRDNVLFNAP